MNMRNIPIMDMTGKWCKTAAACFGASVFFTAVYDLGLINLSDAGFGTVLFSVLLPLCLGVAFIVMLACLRYNAAGLYGIMGAAMCLLIMIQCIMDGDFLRTFLAILWYTAIGAVFVFTAIGSLRYPSLTAAMIATALIVRVLVFDLGSLGVKQWVGEAGVLCALIALMLLPFSFRFRDKK